MSDQKKDKVHWAWLLMFPGIIIAWGITWWLLVDHAWAQRGTFGDMFGGLNALFSGLAFAGLIYAILLQRKELQIQRRELELQREELKLTREELKGQKEQMALQNDTLRKQNFETTFFNMLVVQENIIKNMEIKSRATSSLVTGRRCMEDIWKRVDVIYSYKDFRDLEENLRCKKVYEHAYLEYQNALGYYFKNLFNILQYIDTSDAGDKYLYTNIVESKMSNFELALLFYHCYSELGRQYHEIVTKYEMFNDLPMRFLLNKEVHEKFYPPEAYGKDAY